MDLIKDFNKYATRSSGHQQPGSAPVHVSYKQLYFTRPSLRNVSSTWHKWMFFRG